MGLCGSRASPRSRRARAEDADANDPLDPVAPSGTGNEQHDILRSAKGVPHHHGQDALIWIVGTVFVETVIPRTFELAALLL